MTFIYFVSSAHTNKIGNGFCNTTIHLKKRINKTNLGKSLNILKNQIKKFLEEDGYKDVRVVILNFTEVSD